jgi:undecaprenyl-diphosphatase
MLGTKTESSTPIEPPRMSSMPTKIRPPASVEGTGDRLAREIPARFVGAVRNHRSALTLVMIAMTAFGVLSVLAIGSEATLLRFDRSVQALVLDSRSEWLNQTMIWLTFLGTRYAIAAVAVGLLVWSWVTKRQQTFVLIIVIAAVLNPVFEIGFKEVVDRVRPAADQLLPGNGPSFPSGHVVAAVGFYGLLPLLAWEATGKVWARFGALLGSAAVVVAVTVSRPYLDVHWTTDVIAGVLLGIMLVVASYQAYLRLPRQEPAAATQAA